jgi:hypothetical protein
MVIGIAEVISSDLFKMEYFAYYNIVVGSLRDKFKFRILYFDKYNTIIQLLSLFVWFCMGVKPEL